MPNDTRPERIEAPAFRDTPRGRLYRPPGHWTQGGVLFVAFVATVTSGSMLAAIVGPMSDAAIFGVTLPVVVVFFGGYALWLARLHALAYDLIGRALLKALFHLLVRRQLPKSPQDVIPSPEKIEEAAVLAQAAGRSFVPVGYLMAPLAGGIAWLVDTGLGGIAPVVCIAAMPVGWGYALGFLARRGYLPIPEEG